MNRKGKKHTLRKVAGTTRKLKFYFLCTSKCKEEFILKIQKLLCKWVSDNNIHVGIRKINTHLHNISI